MTCLLQELGGITARISREFYDRDQSRLLRSRSRKIVSEAFNGISQREKQAIVWDALKDELQAEAQYVSLAMALGTDEL